MAYFEIPLSPEPQSLTVNLGGTDYRLTLLWRDVQDGGWVLDIAGVDGVDIVTGIPLVTGADLLAQYGSLGIVGGLYVGTDHDPDAVPLFSNLGTTAHLYYKAA